MFTSLEKTAVLRDSTYTILCTTYEVIWIDDLRPGVPALSWRHDYGGGRLRDLELSVLPADSHGEDHEQHSSPRDSKY